MNERRKSAIVEEDVRSKRGRRATDLDKTIPSVSGNERLCERLETEREMPPCTSKY
jgi:hypothetical protein